jgi:hypothetical protein
MAEGEGRLRLQFARGLGHLIIWTLVLIPTAIEATRGWIPTGDDAQAVAKSLDVFSLRPPVLGMVTTTFPNSVHDAYNLGPLMFWLLAIPVRIDPTTGALWGSAIFCGAAFSVALEAALRNRLWVGAGFVVAVVVDLAWRAPGEFTNLVFNPYFGIAFLSASAVLAYVVAAGNHRWWPVLVGFGSVAAQSHLALTAPALVLIVGAPLLSLRQAQNTRWLAWGGAVGAVCWLPMIGQQIFGNPGNLSVLWSDKAHQASLGIGFGLRSLATAASPFPVWLRQPGGLPYYPAPNSIEAVIDDHAAVLGALALVVLIAVVAWATRVGQQNLAALGGITLLMSVGVIASFSDYPAGNLASSPLDYLAPVLQVVGILWWMTGAWVVVIGLQAASLPTRFRVPTIGAAIAGVVLIAAPVYAAATSVSRPPRVSAAVLDQITDVNSYVTAHIHGRSVTLVMPRPGGTVASVAIALDLRSHAWQVNVPTQIEEYAGALFAGAHHWPRVTIKPDPPAVLTCVYAGHECAGQLILSTN